MKESEIRALQHGQKFNPKKPIVIVKKQPVKRKSPWLTSGQRIVEQLSTWVYVALAFGLGYLAATAANYL